MRTLQEVFDATIASGSYQPEITTNSSWYMCGALYLACNRGVITAEEYGNAIIEIHAYILLNSTKRIHTLCGMLTYMHLPNTFEDRKAIYSDWKNRPGLHQKSSTFKRFLDRFF